MTFFESLIWPLSFLYGSAARLRAWSYRSGLLRQKRLKGIVISVGNLTVGGTGKTPTVLWLAQRFSDNGKRTGILCRGYRPLPQRARSGDYAAIPEGWNDEMVLLRDRLGKGVEFGAHARRYEKGKELEELGVECLILDDGFQHLPLSRDVDIVLIDATNPFGGGHLLPAGRLREPVSALRRADIVVITRSNHAPPIEAIIRQHTAAPVFYANTELKGIEAYGPLSFPSGKAALPGKTFFVFCGIGNPSAFCGDLKRWGISVVGCSAYRDHHLYTDKDISQLEDRAIAAGADSLLCTEKDIYDLMPAQSDRFSIYFCKIAMRFNDQEGLWRAILNIIERKRSKAW